MINFSRSSFMWKSHPWQPDPYYKWPGGFVGDPGQAYHVRFGVEARCAVRRLDSGVASEIFLGEPCRSEYTIAAENLFQIPSGEWRMAFSRHCQLSLAGRPSGEEEDAVARPLAECFAEHQIDIRSHGAAEVLDEVGDIVAATLANDLLSGRCRYRDPEGAFEVEIEFPVNVMNLNVADGQFQVCTGPVIVPDLSSWDGAEVPRLFVAHVAFSRFDRLELILRRRVEAAPQERQWLDAPRGRDRHELHDPKQVPAGYPPSRPQPTVYNETWDLAASNVVLRAAEG